MNMTDFRTLVYEIMWLFHLICCLLERWIFGWSWINHIMKIRLAIWNTWFVNLEQLINNIYMLIKCELRKAEASRLKLEKWLTHGSMQKVFSQYVHSHLWGSRWWWQPAVWHWHHLPPHLAILLELLGYL